MPELKIVGIPMLIRGFIEDCEAREYPARDGRPARTVFELNVFVKKVGYFKVTAPVPVEVNEEKLVDISVGVTNDSYASAKQPRLSYLAHKPASVGVISPAIENAIDSKTSVMNGSVPNLK